MKAVQIINELKKYSKEYTEDEEKDLIDIRKFIKEDYSIGFVINLIKSKYEVYMFIVSDVEDEVASTLKIDYFKNLDEAKSYFNELIDKYSNMELNNIIENF